MIDPLQKIYEFYKKELEFQSIVFKNFSLPQKILLIGMMPSYVSLFILGINAEPVFHKIMFTIIGILLYISLYLFTNRFSDQAMNKLEPKISPDDNFSSQYTRYKTRRLLEFNESKLHLTKEELIALGEDGLQLYETKKYELKFPKDFISIVIAVIAFLTSLYGAESLSGDLKANLLLIVLICSLLFVSLWFMIKIPFELFMNSSADRLKRITEILIGLKYKK